MLTMRIDSSAVLDNLKIAFKRGEYAERWLVAYSGGVDSSVLLHALVQWRAQEDWPGSGLVALHVNHKLHPDADRWQDHCRQQCQTWGVEFVCEQVVVNNRGHGIEAAARSARYAMFAKHAQQHDILLTAHHQDDQAETLLLRLLRGAGSKGLSAMSPSRIFAKAQLLRPLLNLSRQQIEDYARACDLAFIQDSSNESHDYDRNYLRHGVLPILKERWPSLGKTWSRTAMVLRENQQALEELAALDLLASGESNERLGWSLALPKVTILSLPRRHNLLRFWCEQHAMSLPEHRHLQALDEALASDQRLWSVQWSGAGVRRFRERIYLLPQLPAPGPWSDLSVSGGDRSIQLPDGATLQLNEAVGGLRRDLPALNLRWRRGGERCRPEFRRHSQSLKKCLQEVGLEPWLRPNVPLIYAGDDLVAVADLWVCAGFGAGDKVGLNMRWQYTLSE